MSKSIPWKAPATIAIKRRGQHEYRPEIAGLTLNAALEYAMDPARPANEALCIWVRWEDEEVRITGRRIAELAADPDRPAMKID